MAGLFVVMLLASVVGIFKPYIPGSKRVYFVVAAVISFVMVGVVAPPKQASKTPNQTSVATKPATDAAAADPETVPTRAEPAAPTSKWDYSESKDEMRGTTTRFATIRSENEVDLDFPYGVVSGTVTVRSRPKDGLNIMFSVDKGQVLCHDFTDSYVSVKFDAKPVQKFSCTSTSDGSSETAFIVNEARFLGQLRSAKKTVIEAEFYQKGNQQFVFDTAGLQWR